MQELCQKHGALFYLDETVTGFRAGCGGCAELYGLTPDIVTYGKALGGGLPMAMIGGRAEMMAGLEWGKVLHFGTHNAGRLALHVTKVMLETMLADDQAGFRRIKNLGKRWRMRSASVAKHSNRHGIVVQGVNSMFQIFFTDRTSHRLPRFLHPCRPGEVPRLRAAADGQGHLHEPLGHAAFAVLHRPYRGRHRSHREGHGEVLEEMP